MKSIFRNILLLTLTILTLFIIVKWDLVRYASQQARGQFNIMYKAEPLEFYLESPSYPDSLKQKIKLVQAVKTFAEGELGFNSEDQYKKLFDQQGKELMWVVTAAYPYELKSYEWKFPILGKVSYKGFFIEKEAVELANKLENQGFDVRLRTASAWSTLGWLNDPLLSNVLNYDSGRLAELIFHELTHDEIFIKDSVDFNENLASFFGQEFTKMFYRNTKGSNNKELEEYLKRLEDRHLLNTFISDYLPKFDSLYSTFSTLSTTEKENRKYHFIKNFKNELKKQSFQTAVYRELSTSDIQVNNAYLLAYKRYSGHQRILELRLNKQFAGNVKKMLKYYKRNFNSL